jgi:hypothetical protein
LLLFLKLIFFPRQAVRDDVKALLLCLRMPDADTQRDLFELTVSKLPSWDVRQFHKVTTNVVENFALRRDSSSGGSSNSGSGVDPILAAKVAQLGVDLNYFLPPAKLNELAKVADEARGLLDEGSASGGESGLAYGGTLNSGAGFSLTNGLDYS